MARFARIDLQIRANRLILANRFRVAELNSLCDSRFGGLRIANRMVRDSHESLARYKINFFCLRIDSDESPPNRPDLRCESPGHSCYPMLCNCPIHNHTCLSGRLERLTTPKSRDSLQLRQRFLPLPCKSARSLRLQDAISLRSKITSEPRFRLRLKWTKLIPTSELPAIPESQQNPKGYQNSWFSKWQVLFDKN